MNSLIVYWECLVF